MECDYPSLFGSGNNSKLVVGSHTVGVQFEIKLHEWIFWKAEIARAVSASAILAFWKSQKCKLIPNGTRKKLIDHLLII